MRSDNRFNKIIVIESHSNNELKTASKLYDDLNILKVRLKHLESKLVNVKDTNEMIQTLVKIENEIKKTNNYPIIHIEAHGSESGISFQKEFAPWGALKRAFTSINIACHNNLLVTLAACKGVYLTNIVVPTEPCPFWALVAPSTEISAGQIETSFQAFYKELLNSLSGDQALDKLNQSALSLEVKFSFIHCINLFKIAYQNYDTRFSHGKALKRRTEELVTKAKKSGRLKNMSVNEIRQKIKCKLKNERKVFEKYKEIFFMSDTYPENSARFNIKYEDVISATK
jgi:hypothetical protein